MKGIKISFIDYKKFLGVMSMGAKKALWFMARDAFVMILILVLICVLFGEFLFYNYILALDTNKTDTITVVKFNESAYNSIIKESNEKESILGNAFGSKYKNPFY